MKVDHVSVNWACVDRLRLAHGILFLIVYVFYGYQVCPFLDDLEIWELAGPAAVVLAVLHVASVAIRKSAARLPYGAAVKRLFWTDIALFAAGGAVLALFNFVAFGFHVDSGGKVVFGFLALGFYIALDLTFEREIRLARHLRQSGSSLPLDARFWPFQTKFVVFSTINLCVISIVVTMVVLKDLIWAAQTDLDPARAQMLIMAELLFILAVLCAYVFRAIQQYGRKTDMALLDERRALVRARAGDFSGRVTVSSQDEFGEIAHLTNQMIARLSAALTEVEETRDVTIKALVSLSSKRDQETGLHLLRTQFYVGELAQELSRSPQYKELIDEDFIEQVLASAPLHDIGKVGVPDAILSKPGKLTDEEFAIMKTHAAIGAEAIAQADKQLGGSSFLSIAHDIARSHHEKWDGSGYPDGLAGESIPLAARLMAVADVYDALRSQRVYKPAMSHADALDVIRKGRGAHFDPTLVDAFLRIEQRFEAIARAHQEPPLEPQGRSEKDVAATTVGVG